MKKIPIAKPYITKEDHRAVLAVLKSGRLSLGPRNRKFEKDFATKLGSRYACSVSSGTAGLHLAMIAAGIGPGDEVITSPFSFIASANAIQYVGAKPVFCDIEETTYNIDPKLIEKKITARTKAILVVHIFGQSSDMSSITKIARRHKLVIIEDACESILATHHGKKVGTFGQSAVFAFYPNKQMTTGEGGMLITNNRKVYELFASLQNQGRHSNMRWLDHKYLGYNYRLDEMSAALGITQLRKLSSMIKKRRDIAAQYTKLLQPHAKFVMTPSTARGNTHTWFLYVIRLAQWNINREKVMNELREQGIETKAYLPSIHLFEFYRKPFGHRKGDFPVSERVSASTLALPMYIGLRPSDIRRICSQLVTTLNRHAK